MDPSVRRRRRGPIASGPRHTYGGAPVARTGPHLGRKPVDPQDHAGPPLGCRRTTQHHRPGRRLDRPLTASASAEGDASASPRAKQGTVDGVMQHLINLEEIGDDNGGRASGTPGYAASRDYVVKKLRKAGYTPTVQEFDFPFFEQLAPTTFEQTAPTPTTYVEDTDFALMTYSGSAT